MTLIAMGSTTVKRARKGADAEYYEMTAIPSAIHVGADGNVDNDVTIRLWHIKGASRTEVTTASNSKVWPHVSSESRGALDGDGNFPYSLLASNTDLAADVENGDSYVVCTAGGVTADKLIIPIVRNGLTGEKASYYEARFVNQDFDVRVDNDHLNGVLYAVFDLRVYHVVGSDATEVSGDGVTVNFSFRNADGTEKDTGTASYNSTTKLISYSNKSLQDPYFGEKTDRITSCHYSISLPSSMGGSTRDGVIPVQFYAPSAFEHSDTLFKSIFAKGSKFSQLVQNVDGIFTRVQRLETNMLMGTTTGLGWTHEKTCSESSYSFDVSTRKFTIINYFPAFRDGITNESTAYSILKSAVLQVVPGKMYILSFKADVGDKVDFIVELKYGTTNAVSDASESYYWKNRKASHDGKAMDVLVPTKGSDGRYFVVFVAKSGYDYMQVMFINAVDGNNYAVTSSTTSSGNTTINGTWPYSGTYKHIVSSSTTVSKDGAVRTTVSLVHAYTGSSTNYVAFTQTTVERVTPTYLYITEPQLEEATRDDIADIEPSDYKSYQNVVESYIKQTADSIKLYADDIILDANHKLVINTPGYLTIDAGNFSLNEKGIITATGATFNQIYVHDAIIDGVIASPFVVENMIESWSIDENGKQTNTTASYLHDNLLYNSEEHTLPWDVSASGRLVTLCHHESVTGLSKFKAPTGMYFYEAGLKRSSITLSRQCVLLKGYGTASKFLGWIVVARIDLAPTHYYGRDLKCLAMGTVTGGDGNTHPTSISYSTFEQNANELTVSRLDTGRYKITIPTAWKVHKDTLMVMVTGFGHALGASSPCKANVYQVESTFDDYHGVTCVSSFSVETSDDTSRNDGSFQFMIYNRDDWNNI